jgi:PilZ domain
VSNSDHAAGPAPAAGERRGSQRRTVLFGAIIASRDGAYTWDVTVKNLSDLGAKVRLPAGGVIPSRCIFINVREGTAYEAIVVWIQPPLWGLRFLESYHLEQLSDPALQFIKRLWLQRRAR